MRGGAAVRWRLVVAHAFPDVENEEVAVEGEAFEGDITGGEDIAAAGLGVGQAVFGRGDEIILPRLIQGIGKIKKYAFAVQKQSLRCKPRNDCNSFSCYAVERFHPLLPICLTTDRCLDTSLHLALPPQLIGIRWNLRRMCR